MAAAALPERQPIGDLFSGVILERQGRRVLALEPAPETHVLAQGDFVIRYGVRYAGKLHLSIVPGMVVTDYGKIMVAEEAWHFLFHGSHLYPRAEVMGHRNDGQDDMPFIKQLDLAASVEALVFPDEVTTLPLASVEALIMPETSEMPPRFVEYLPIYPSMQQWGAALDER